MAIGKDEVLAGLFNDIVARKEIEIQGAKVRLTFPEAQANKVTDAALSNRSEVETDQWLIDSTKFIPSALFELDTWDQLSGHSHLLAEGKPIFPIGLFDKGYIHNKLSKGILAVKEYRTPYLTFRGVRSSSIKGKGSSEIVGFYQQQFDTTVTYVASIRNQSGDLVGNSDISKESGRFHVNLKEPVTKGKVEIHINGESERTLSFALLQDIQFDIVPAKSFQDAYGRKFLVSSKKTRSRPSTLIDSTWARDEYLDHASAVQNLSNLFKRIFDHLGPHVLIADPYFLGPMETLSDGTEKPLSHDQLALINAWVHSSVEYEAQTLTVLGSPKITGQVQSATAGSTKFEDLMARYDNRFKRLIGDNKLEPILKPGSILFLRGAEFHNRYWFAVEHKDGHAHLKKCLIVTNSVGNMNEVDMVVVTDDDQLARILRRSHGLYTTAEECLTI
ncbi:MAG: hypothetical protein IPN38_16130 [Flavobacteriales bacterium]|nr:hypothetical protein [Flavobacteriales bacterium]